MTLILGRRRNTIKGQDRKVQSVTTIVLMQVINKVSHEICVDILCLCFHMDFAMQPWLVG